MFMSWPVSLRSTRKPKTGQYKTRLCSKRFYLILIFCFSVIWQWVQIVRITGYAEEKEIVILGPDSIDKAVTKTNLVNNTNVVDSSNNIKKESNRRRQPWQTCEIVKGFEGINRIQVFNDTNLSVKRPRIYCFMMTQSSRKRRFQAVFNTWGRKCDHLLIASDKSNPKLNTVKMKTNSTYKDLWNKLNETLQYISDTTNEFQDYDWYFKVDDDTFVIIENLIKFLTSQEVQAKSRDNLPLIYGRRFAWPILKALKFFPTFFGQESQQNQQFKDLFYDKVKEGERLIYPSGGAGYIMNRQYATLLLSTFKSKQTLRGIPDEGASYMNDSQSTLLAGLSLFPFSDNISLNLYLL